ncbi:unnamed protein product [Ostreobium quekettii]|uniref:FAS1 domain-containing protein n=1 Tax=Ostreobium quekettii TaxID=121088 RepID=A0A8S1ILH6_9CHLO|nr:unnamed protein product [Ostreobium quekettii]|eukprot:evm.model.scf_601.5 EVM.evm.TU.scf_601.5   scf_601:43162-49877(+)
MAAGDRQQQRCWMVCALLLALAAAVGGQSVELKPLGCDCSDIDPREGFDGPPIEGTCSLQRQWGQCDEPFLLNTIEEIPEGYCQITCGRCPCCKTYRQIALDEGFQEFVNAMDATNMGEYLDNPGFMASFLVPPEGSIYEWLQPKSNVAIDATTLSAAEKANLQALLQIHIVLPEARANAPWTSPFFLDGVHMATMEGRALAVRQTGGQAVILNGQTNQVNLLGGDKEACKGFLLLVDGVLTPEHSGIDASNVPGVEAHLFDSTPSAQDTDPTLPAWPANYGPLGYHDTVNPVVEPQRG